MHPISFHPSTHSSASGGERPRFSIVIPTWNSLAMLQTCIRAVRAHSTFDHQVIVHVNEGSDGTLEWVGREGLDHTHSAENCGICYGMNAAATLATTDYIVYLNDDMVVLPDWDAPLVREIETIGHEFFFLSSTLIEPGDTGNACVIAPKDFGGSVEDFREEELLREYTSFPRDDWSGATWPLSVVHRNCWNLVGGYSIEFTPGIASDPDFSMKLWQLGVRYFKGIGESRVYHFMSKSTGRTGKSGLQKNDGRAQFLNKWGMTISTFSKHYLRLGKKWKGPLENPEHSAQFVIDSQRSKWKRAGQALK